MDTTAQVSASHRSFPAPGSASRATGLEPIRKGLSVAREIISVQVRLRWLWATVLPASVYAQTSRVTPRPETASDDRKRIAPFGLAWGRSLPPPCRARRPRRVGGNTDCGEGSLEPPRKGVWSRHLSGPAPAAGPLRWGLDTFSLASLPIMSSRGGFRGNRGAMVPVGVR
jgi:hypothetical protein